MSRHEGDSLVKEGLVSLTDFVSGSSFARKDIEYVRSLGYRVHPFQYLDPRYNRKVVVGLVLGGTVPPPQPNENTASYLERTNYSGFVQSVYNGIIPPNMGFYFAYPQSLENGSYRLASFGRMRHRRLFQDQEVRFICLPNDGKLNEITTELNRAQRLSGAQETKLLIDLFDPSGKAQALSFHLGNATGINQ